ncbi:hypothetical protein EPO17_03155 [Patescibacteria group bacterium]|nr:MAG: hypothetical protein EPO17_03155 [Patescibacteria group bacterium]
MKHLIEQLNNYSGAIGIIITFISGIWALLKLREYLKDKRFKTYHELIDEMVNETRNPDRVIKLDRQVAIIFELRNFTSYYPVTRRILTDLKIAWENQPRAITEIDLTLDFISRNWFIRMYRKLLKI